MNKERCKNMISESPVQGAIFGFIFSAVIFCVSFISIAGGKPFETVLQFFGILPVFLVEKVFSGMSDPVSIAVYFIYWILVGGLVGAGISRGKKERMQRSYLLF